MDYEKLWFELKKEISDRVYTSEYRDMLVKMSELECKEVLKDDGQNSGTL